VIAKPGLDGHDRGAKVIARALRDAWHGSHLHGAAPEPEQIVAAAAQEDADVIGLSILSGAHLPICRRVVELLQERGMRSVRVFVGGSFRARTSLSSSSSEWPACSCPAPRRRTSSWRSGKARRSAPEWRLSANSLTGGGKGLS